MPTETPAHGARPAKPVTKKHPADSPTAPEDTADATVETETTTDPETGTTTGTGTVTKTGGAPGPQPDNWFNP